MTIANGSGGDDVADTQANVVTGFFLPPDPFIPFSIPVALSDLEDGAGDLISGNDGNDRIIAGNANDVIDGGTDNDTISGMLGLDFMDGGDGLDTHDVTFFTGQYIWNMSTGVTNFAGETAINFEAALMGSGNDSVTGTGGNDTISGGGGNDTITGSIGFDVLDGGSGIDTHNVTFFAGQYIWDMTTGITNFAGETAINFEVANMGTGNDSVAGNNAANTINGSGGNDTISGGNGIDVLDGGTGIDTFDAVVAGLFGGNFDWNMVTGGTNLAGETAVNFENAIMGAGNNSVLASGIGNSIDGGAGNDTISGLAGNDTLIGNTGNDVLFGGTGDDTYIVDELGEADETGGDGIDTVRSLADNYVLGSNIENLILIGSIERHGSGNDLANRITGNDSSNILFGGLGRDIISGKSGFDYFVYTSIAESGITGATRDIITDFKVSTGTIPADRIDLSGIDAIPGGADNAFIFGGAFLAGHVRAVQVGTDTVVQLNIDADVAPEMTILLKNVTATNIDSGDFIL